MSVTGSVGEASEHGRLGVQGVSFGVMDVSALCAKPEQRRQKRQNVATMRAQESRQVVRKRVGGGIEPEIGGAAEEPVAGCQLAVVRRTFRDGSHVYGGYVLSAGAESLPRAQGSTPRVNAERRCKVIGAAGGNNEKWKLPIDNICEMAMNGAVAAKNDSNIGTGKVVRPGDGPVCFKRTQIGLTYMRSDDSNGAQTGAG